SGGDDGRGAEIGGCPGGMEPDDRRGGGTDGDEPRGGGTEGVRELAGPVPAAGSRGGAFPACSIAGGENQGLGAPDMGPGAWGGTERPACPPPRKPSTPWRCASMIPRVVRRYSSTAVSRSAAAGVGSTSGAVTGRSAPAGSSPLSGRARC